MTNEEKNSAGGKGERTRTDGAEVFGLGFAGDRDTADMQIAVKKRCNNRSSTARAHSSGSLSFYHLLSHIKHFEYTHLCLLLLPLFPPLILNSLVSLLLVEEYIYIYRSLS